jgi:uncharacterized membrane protein YedE/YeeE
MFRIDNRKPYLYGALSGLVLVASVAFSGNYFGASTTFARAAAFFEGLILPERVLNNVYFQKHAPAIDWQLLFLVGIFLGALASSLISGDFRKTWIPDMWKERMGSGMARRALWAFAGGILVIIGARLAGGCPSGHGLSGMSQLSVSSFISLFGFFAGGLISANLLYRTGR